MDLVPLVNNVQYYLSQGKSGINMVLDSKYFDKYLKNTMLKNDFMMTILEFGTMNSQMQEMKTLSKNVVNQIELEIAK